MSEVIKNSHVMEKLQEEIRSGLGRKSTLDPNDLSNLKFLKMVVKETLRLHPPAPLLIPHKTLRHCKLGNTDDGYDVLAQTRVLINAWAIGRDPNCWKNPNEFFPKRFEDNDMDFRGQHFELIPFGAGRRICPSIGMASSNVELILANLLYHFDWEMPCGMRREDISMEEEGGITTHKKAPLCLVPIRYDLARVVR